MKSECQLKKVIIDASLPFPTDELKIVSDVKGTFCSWPVKLVNVSTTPKASTPPPKSPSAPQAPPPTVSSQVGFDDDWNNCKHLKAKLQSFYSKN